MGPAFPAFTAAGETCFPSVDSLRRSCAAERAFEARAARSSSSEASFPA